MKHGSASRLFWGLFLLFFNINIYNLNIFTTWLGIILLFSALWQMKELGGKFNKAFYFSTFQLVLQMVNFLMTCSSGNANSNLSILIIVISAINLLVVIGFLFYGLAEIADQQGEKDLADGLRRGFYFYLFLEAAIPFLMLFNATMILLPVALICFVYILSKVYKFAGTIVHPDDAVCERALTVQFRFILCGYIGATLLSGAAALYLSNTVPVRSAVYHKNDVSSASNIAEIKAKMLGLKFDKEILSDLPDSEILKYKSIRAFHETIYDQDSDGGKVRMIACVSAFKNGKILFLDYYRWTKNPANQFCDVFGLQYPSAYITLPQNQNFTGAALYDRKEATRTVTYRADWVIKQNEPVSFYSPKVKCRIFGGNAFNQRGYIAIDAQVAQPAQALTFNTLLVYCHQCSILNFPYKDPFVFYTEQSPEIEDVNGFPFERFNLPTFEDYKPQKAR